MHIRSLTISILCTRCRYSARETLNEEIEQQIDHIQIGNTESFHSAYKTEAKIP